MEKVKKVTVNLALVSFIAIVLFWGQTLYRQHVQFNKGEKALNAGDFVMAVAGYESAIHMYTPGSTLIETAALRLWDLAQGCEQRGEVSRALIAYRSLRSSFYAVAGLYTPGSEWIDRAEAKIAELVRRQQ